MIVKSFQDAVAELATAKQELEEAKAAYNVASAAHAELSCLPHSPALRDNWVKLAAAQDKLERLKRQIPQLRAQCVDAIDHITAPDYEE